MMAGLGGAGLSLVWPFTAAAQSVYTPRRGSADRRRIMNALRVPVMRDLRQRTIFRVKHLRVRGRHAFMIARPLRPGGKPINYRRTRFAADRRAGAFEDEVVALLIRSPRGWQVVHYVIGATDVVYDGWWNTYRAPRAIFP